MKEKSMITEITNANQKKVG